MRIEKFTLAGLFGIPNSAKPPVPGTLTIEDGGSISLDIMGTFDETPGDFTKVTDIPRVLGLLENNRNVTIEGCIYRSKPLPISSVVNSKLQANAAIIGGLFENGPVIFDSFSFSIEGLDEWIAKTGIQVTHDFAARTAQISYQPPGQITLWHDPILTLTAYPTWTVPGAPVLKEASITQAFRLNLRSSKPQDLLTFASLAHKIVHLLCFAVDQTVSIREVRAESAQLTTLAADGQALSRSLNVYYQSLSFSESPPSVNWYEMLFLFPAIEARSQAIFDAWLRAYDRILPAMSLYFSSRTGEHRYLNGRFLALAQALETYHRRSYDRTLMPKSEFKLLLWAILEAFVPYKEFLHQHLWHANEPSLADRLREMLSQRARFFGDEQAQKTLIQKIVRTRNYFTHYSKEMEGKAADGIDLWHLCLKMEALYQFFLLKEIGLSDQEIETIASNHRSLRQKINPEGRGSDTNMDESTKTIWYAVYGSNLSKPRFSTYISGGTPPGTTFSQEGCSNKTPPERTEPLTISGNVYFSGKSSRWSGGMAFVDIRNDKSSVFGRAYLISLEQFADIIKQENGMPISVPISLPALAEIITKKSVELAIGGAYKRILYLGSKDGFPIFTLTGTTKRETEAPTAPSEAYLRTIAVGIRETYPTLDSKTVGQYLSAAPGVSLLQPEQISKVLRDVFSETAPTPPASGMMPEGNPPTQAPGHTPCGT